MTGPQLQLPSLAGLEVEDAKSSLRGLLREHRNQRSTRRRTEAADALAIVASNLAHSLDATTIALYASRAGEPSTTALLERLSRDSSELLLPVLGDGLQREWATYKGVGDLVERAPGRPPEPSGPSLPMDAIERATLVLVPALAVDTRGARLGQGGGWYDRVLTHVNPQAAILALTFADEVFDANEFCLPLEPHDKLVHGVITPQGVQWFR